MGNLLVLKRLAGGAQPIAVAIDAEGGREIVGTLGGDDTILIILRSEEHREKIVARIEAIADRRGGKAPLRGIGVAPTLQRAITTSPAAAGEVSCRASGRRRESSFSQATEVAATKAESLANCARLQRHRG